MKLIWIVLGCLATIYFLTAEAIDMAGRIEYVEKHWPNLLKWVRHRTSYRILLLIATLLCISNVYLFFHPELANTTTISNPAPVIPRIGNGPDRYKNIPNNSLAIMIEDEVEKVSQNATICTTKELIPIPGNTQPVFSVEQMRKWFVRDFKSDDFPEILNLREEAVIRLGPASKDIIGEDNLKIIAMSGMEKSEDVCRSVLEVLPYLKKLSTTLRRTPTQ